MTVQSKIGDVVENADIDRDTPQPEIHVEEKRLTLHDFLKTAVKINGSDIHLQAGSIPMIRVDGRARFLDVPALDDELMKSYVDQIINNQAEPPEKRQILDHKGAVDVAYAVREGRPLPHQHLPQPRALRDRHAAHRDEDPALRGPQPPAVHGEDVRVPPRAGGGLGHDRLGQEHDAGGDHRQDQPHAGRADHHVEDPIEYQHENAKSLVSQVEVGADSESFEYALKAMMRQDPTRS
jgi:twitching motility protein PilT